MLHDHWNGGRFKIATGYILVYVGANSPYKAMCQKSTYILEHRLIMAKHLGRLLDSWEIVHHRNGIKDDNRLANLELFPSQTEHLPSIWMRRRINELEAENQSLRAQLETANA